MGASEVVVTSRCGIEEAIEDDGVVAIFLDFIGPRFWRRNFVDLFEDGVHNHWRRVHCSGCLGFSMHFLVYLRRHTPAVPERDAW